MHDLAGLRELYDPNDNRLTQRAGTFAHAFVNWLLNACCVIQNYSISTEHRANHAQTDSLAWTWPPRRQPLHCHWQTVCTSGPKSPCSGLWDRRHARRFRIQRMSAKLLSLARIGTWECFAMGSFAMGSELFIPAGSILTPSGFHDFKRSG